MVSCRLCANYGTEECYNCQWNWALEDNFEPIEDDEDGDDE